MGVDKTYVPGSRAVDRSGRGTPDEGRCRRWGKYHTLTLPAFAPNSGSGWPSLDAQLHELRRAALPALLVADGNITTPIYFCGAVPRYRRQRIHLPMDDLD